MRMLSGRLHWLTVGLALLVSAGKVHGQLGVPSKPAGQAQQRQVPARSASYMAGAAPGYEMLDPNSMGRSPGGDMPMHMAMQGPPPMDVTMQPSGNCDPGMTCDSTGGGMYGGGICGGCGMPGCGGGCGLMGGGGLLGGAGNGCLCSGQLACLLGPLAPYSEGGRGAQRWFDISLGTIALARTSGVGPFQISQQNPITGEFASTTLVSTLGVNGTPVLYSTDVSANQMRYGLEAIANLQTGPGAHVEVRYFGLNKWNDSASARSFPTPDLYSVFSLYGTDPGGIPPGFDDTDRSFIHTINLTSALHSGEVNFRRQFVTPAAWLQGGWLMGIRYLDIDEQFGFSSVGSRNNTFTFNQLRYFNYDVQTRNQLTGFQVGSNLWASLLPGLMAGVEGKVGAYGNHNESESSAVANSIPGAHEFISGGRTAFVTEFTSSVVYRLSYSWAMRASYNLLYVDNIALAQENFNTRDFSNALGGGQFTANRVPFLNTDGEALYQGFTLAGEWTY